MTRRAKTLALVAIATTALVLSFLFAGAPSRFASATETPAEQNAHADDSDASKTKGHEASGDQGTRKAPGESPAADGGGQKAGDAGGSGEDESDEGDESDGDHAAGNTAESKASGADKDGDVAKESGQPAEGDDANANAANAAKDEPVDRDAKALASMSDDPTLTGQAVPGDNVTSQIEMGAGESKSGSFAIGPNGVVLGPKNGTARITNATVANSASNARNGGYTGSNGSALISRGANGLELERTTINSGLNTLVLNIFANSSINAHDLTLNGSANDGNDVPFLMIGAYPNGKSGTLSFFGDSTIFGARGSVVGGNGASVVNVAQGTLTIRDCDIKFGDGIKIVVSAGATLVVERAGLENAWIDNAGTVNIDESDLRNCVLKTRANAVLGISGSKLHDSWRKSQETMVHTEGDGATVNISDTEIYDNENAMGAGNPGASIVKVQNGTLNLSGVNVHDNHCGTRGGALYVTGSTLTIDDASTFEKNSAPFIGGAIFMSGTEATIGAATFKGNGYQSEAMVGNYGGALYAEGGSTVTLNGTKYTGNRVWDGGRFGTGGAVFVTDADTSLNVHGAKFEGNSAHVFGGAIAVSNYAHAQIGDLNGDPTEFTGNKVTNGRNFAGGALFIDLAFVTLSNAAIFGNTAPDAGGAISSCGTGTAQVWTSNGADIFDNAVSSGSAIIDSEIGAYQDLYISTKDHKDYTGGEGVRFPGRENFNEHNVFEFELVERMFNGGLHRWSVKNLVQSGRDEDTERLYHSIIAQSDPTNRDTSQAKVVFTQNTVEKDPGAARAVSGGAIACNGLLEIGSDTEIKVVKVWEDGKNADGIRPTPEQFANDIRILANGEQIGDDVRSQLQIDVVDLRDHPFVFSDNVIDPNDIDTPEDYGDNDAWLVIISGLPHTNEAGVIEYSVEEVPIPGYEQTNRQGSEETHFEFTNRHEPGTRKLAKVELEATKSLAGRELVDQEFLFELRDAAGALVQTKACDVDGVVVFDPLYFDTAGEYDYTIAERVGDDTSVTYDTSRHGVHVVVTEDSDRNLSAVTTYTRDGQTVADVAFANEVQTTQTYEAASVGLEVTKTLEGGILEAGQFSFHLYGATGELLQTKANDANGIVLFDALRFDKPGTYAYQIREDEDNPIITYDEAYHVVTFHVHDMGGGKLLATKTIELNGVEVDSPSFHNVVTPPKEDPENPENPENPGTPSRETPKEEVPVYEPVSVELEAAKTLEGRVLEAGEYSFRLDDADGRTIQTKTNDENGLVLFDAIRFDREGTYTYRVREVVGEDERTTYDEKVHVVTVTVRPDEDGALVASTHITVDGEEVDSLAFDNLYENDKTYAPIELRLEAHKTLKGRALKAEEFSFKLDGAEGQTIQTRTNDAKGLVAFDAVSVDRPGTYVYAISEVKGDAAGVTYDKRLCMATVRVREATDGTLAADPVVYTLLREDVESASFENTYSSTQKPKDSERTPNPKKSNPTPAKSSTTTTPASRTSTPSTGDATVSAGIVVAIVAAGVVIIVAGVVRRRK